MRRYQGAKVQVENSTLQLLLLLGNSKLHLLLRSHYCSDPVRMEDFVIVTDFEGGENIEMDVGDDGTLTMTSIQSQFGKDAINWAEIQKSCHW